jgi:DNA polymerase I/DNA polymerase-2
MKTHFCLLDAYYEGSVIKLFGVDEKGKAVFVIDKTYRPYFYVLPKNKNKTTELLKKNKMVKEIIESEKVFGSEKREFLKVYVDSPASTSKVRDMIKHKPELIDCYEYNITYYKKYLIDREFYPLDWLEVEGEEKNKFIEAKKITKSKKTKIPKLRFLAFDIEVIDSQIIMISMVDNSGFSKVLTYKKSRGAEIVENEKEMLERFVEIINNRNPDVIFTFNGDMFDFEILRERADALKVPLMINRDNTELRAVRRAHISATRLTGRLHIDLFNFINNILSSQLQIEAVTLSDVAQELLGKSKIELSFEELVEAWRSGKIDNLVEYCMNDSKLTIELGQLLFPQILELSRISGQLPFDCSRLTFGLLVEWYLLRKAGELGYVAPNTPHWEEIQARRELKPYKGAYVAEPVLGLHENIAVFDFRSLYPSIIVTYNISPETLNCACCKGIGWKVPETKNWFCKKQKGFIPRLIQQLIQERIKIKSKMKKIKQSSNLWKQLDEQQKAIKTLANASYGYNAYPGARWYCRECAEAAAAFGRQTIKNTIEESKKFGFEVLYADTDSLFVKKQKNLENATKAFLKKINKTMPGILELELQGIYTRGLFVPAKLGTYIAKKRYALIDAKGNVTVRGFEAVRRDWSDLAKNLQHDVLRLVLQKKEKEAVQKVKETIEKIKSRKIQLKDIAIRTMLGKELAEYKALAPHIAVARKILKMGHEVRQGMIISYIITKRPGKISDKAEPIDKVKITDYDIDYYLNNQILAVALRVLGTLGYKKEDFI